MFVGTSWEQRCRYSLFHCTYVPKEMCRGCSDITTASVAASSYLVSFPIYHDTVAQ